MAQQRFIHRRIGKRKLNRINKVLAMRRFTFFPDIFIDF